MLDKTATSEAEIVSLMQDVGRRAKTASAELAVALAESKQAALFGAAKALRTHSSAILSANAIDMENGRETGLSNAMLDRLLLTPDRIDSMADAVTGIAEMDDPIGQTIARWERPNGLDIARVRTPLGVIGVIYESRPNVTADAGALCLKAGNAVILRGGTDSFNSS
ncbi:MAG: gamma-glutamyl-phosphate reductase, partial [Pseudomonadota bacterium]